MLIAELRGLAYLAWLTFRRQVFARKSIVASVLIIMLTMATAIWTQRVESRAQREVADATVAQTEASSQDNSSLEEESQVADASNLQIDFLTNIVIVRLFVSFLLPILVLTYATAAIGEEREDRTLVYTLIRPLSRFRVYLAKAVGILPVVATAALGGFGMICLAGGEAGQFAWCNYWSAILLGCLAYTALFMVFGASLPKPVIMAVVYVFLIEALLGSMPGTIKRLAVSFYVNCVIFEAAEKVGVQPELPMYESVSATSALLVLATGTVVLICLGGMWFARREYRDLA